MDSGMDFLNWLETDMSTKIFTSMEDPADLARITSVSRTWRQYVSGATQYDPPLSEALKQSCQMVENALWKRLCLRRFPQLSKVYNVVEVKDCEANESSAGSSNSKEWETLEREHKAYAILGQRCKEFTAEDCISEAICASSTDNYPDESIQNTLDPKNIVAGRASYWSSKGQSDPSVPETLIYKLDSDFCVITEINVQPFRAYFHLGFPVYSARYVRFRVGYPKSPLDLVSHSAEESSHHDQFVWTYTSQKFRMAKESVLQKFKLPEPVLCIGGIVEIELSGRVQKQQIDGLFYICVAHVQVLGQSLAPALSVEVLDPSGRFVLKNNLQANGYCKPSLPKKKSHAITDQGGRRWEDLMNELEEYDEDYVGYLLAFEGEPNVESDEEFVL